MKTYGPISVDLREKRRKKEKNLYFSLLTLSLSRLTFSSLLTFLFFFFFFRFYPFFYFFILLIIIWIHGSYCLIQIRFCPETIYLFSVHFILNELSSSHFLIFEIFVKISSLKSSTTYHPENRKNILIVTEFDETFLGL